MESKKSIKNEQVSARINKRLKKNVEKIIERLGLGHSEAINIFYNQIYLRHGLPFEVIIPDGFKTEHEQEPEPKENKKAEKKPGSNKKPKKKGNIKAKFGPGTKGMEG